MKAASHDPLPICMRIVFMKPMYMVDSPPWISLFIEGRTLSPKTDQMGRSRVKVTTRSRLAACR